MSNVRVPRVLVSAKRSFVAVALAAGLVAAGCTVRHGDGSATHLELRHSYTGSQLSWFRAGSALNAIGRQGEGDACESMRTLLLDQTMRMNLDSTQLEAVRVDLVDGEFPESSVSGVYLTTGMRYEQAFRDLDALGSPPAVLEDIAEGYRSAFRMLADGYLAASEAVLEEDVDDLRSAIDELVSASEISQNEAIPACS